MANSDGHYIYYCGQESLRNGVAIIVNKRTQNAVLRCNLKNEKIVYDYDYAKAFDCVDHNYGKFLKRREYQTTWPASWGICMQVKKQQLKLDMEQLAGSK